MWEGEVKKDKAGVERKTLFSEWEIASESAHGYVCMCEYMCKRMCQCVWVLVRACNCVWAYMSACECMFVGASLYERLWVRVSACEWVWVHVSECDACECVCVCVGLRASKRGTVPRGLSRSSEKFSGSRKIRFSFQNGLQSRTEAKALVAARPN